MCLFYYAKAGTISSMKKEIEALKNNPPIADRDIQFWKLFEYRDGSLWSPFIKPHMQYEPGRTYTTEMDVRYRDLMLTVDAGFHGFCDKKKADVAMCIRIQRVTSLRRKYVRLKCFIPVGSKYFKSDPILGEIVCESIRVGRLNIWKKIILALSF